LTLFSIIFTLIKGKKLLQKYKKTILLSSLFLLSFGILVLFYFFPQNFSKQDNTKEKNSRILGTATEKKDIMLTQKAAEKITTPTPSPTAAVTIQRSPIYLGIWTQGFWDTGSQTLHPEVIPPLEQSIGKRFAIAHYYRGWEALRDPSLVSQLQTIIAGGRRPMISVNPYFLDGCKGDGKPLYKAIAQGNCDDFLKAAGQNLKQVSAPFFLRFAYEMNAVSMHWEIHKSGSSNEDFIGAWRRMHDIIRGEGAVQAVWVFSPNAEQVPSPSFNLYYPGDAYVDWLGMDGYNWGKTQSWSSWQSFQQVFGTSYIKLTQLSPQKPIMLSEVNTTDNGGNKASWLTDMLSFALPHGFPMIRAIVFYNEDRSGSENVDWRLEKSPSYLQAVRKGINSPLYVSSF
jgi:hypothetical protein